jgi:hypothetical protein
MEQLPYVHLPFNNCELMKTTSEKIRIIHQNELAFPLLSALELEAEEFKALCRQGFVSLEQRRAKLYGKLRFRVGNRQRVKYVRGDQIAGLIAELNQLQAVTRLNRILLQSDREAWRILRASKLGLEPVLAANGLFFHGLAIRRRRIAKPN